MGTIRFMLAMSVLLAHAYKPIFFDGKLSVQIFYLISGFLISFILVDLKSYANNILFYKNRFLRIYPLYFLVAIISMIVFIFAEIFLNGWHYNNFFIESNLLLKVYSVLVNITILGQDSVFFLNPLSIQHIDLVEMKEFPFQNILIIPPSWTLSLEIYFYLLAPFIVRNKFILITVFLLASLLKMSLVLCGIGLDRPFNYQFFPAELSIFLLGAISHQFWKPLLQNIQANSLIHLSNYIFIIALGSCVLGQFYLKTPLVDYLVIILFAFALPFLFEFQRKSRIDRKIGDLSYPIYIWHWIIIILVSFIMPKLGLSNELLRVLLIALFTIIASIISNNYILNKIDLIREKNKSLN